MSALAAVAWWVGWSGPGRAAVLALIVGWGVVAARTGPDRVGSRAWRSGAAARAALARGRGPSSGGAAGGRKAWRRRAATLAHVNGIFGSHRILGNVVRQGFGIAGDNVLITREECFAPVGQGPRSWV